MITQENKDDLQRIKSIIGHLKTDFEMLQDGRWDMHYSDGSECESSIENCDKILELVGKLIPSEVNECILTPIPPCNTSYIDSRGIYDDTQTLNKEIY